MLRKEDRENSTDSGKGVAGVGDEQASFTYSSVTDGNALNEPRGAHCRRLLAPNFKSSRQTLSLSISISLYQYLLLTL